MIDLALMAFAQGCEFTSHHLAIQGAPVTSRAVTYIGKVAKVGLPAYQAYQHAQRGGAQALVSLIGGTATGGVMQTAVEHIGKSLLSTPSSQQQKVAPSAHVRAQQLNYH
jgi:hypothetical protein